MNGAALQDMNAAFLPFAHPRSGIASGARPPSDPRAPANVAPSPSMFPIIGPQRKRIQTQLMVQHSVTKSRVETQIPVKLLLQPFPGHIKKLHLQRHTISKPKLLSKPSQPKSADTLELYTTLVCTSAMTDKTKLAMALVRAAAQPQQDRVSPAASPGGESATGDEDSPLNGGDVQICQGCVTRERKRAGRKKAKKPEEDELWIKDEARRIIVFNTTEYKEWSEAPATCELRGPHDVNRPDMDSRRVMALSEGTMTVELPMRIACYCRHHHEKTGFQVIMTLKDHQDKFVAQAISASIMITDDHKTHAPPVSMGHPGHFVDETQKHLPTGNAMQRGPMDGYGLARNAHSATDLAALQTAMQNRFSPHNVNPYGLPQQTSQPASAISTPNNLSRQASPSAHVGPTGKRRKASDGSARLMDNLAMTPRLQTSAANHPGMSSTALTGPGSAFPSHSSVTSPFSAAFPNGASPAPRSFARHRPQRSAQISTGPSTPNTMDHGAFDFNNRSQSLENLAASVQFSAPSSTRPSRAPSPTAFSHVPHMTRAAAHSSQLRTSGGPQAVNGMSGSHALNGLGASYGVQGTPATHSAGPPTLLRISPAEGPKAGGIEITCLGSGFHQGLQVQFGDMTATVVTLWSETTLICVLPPAMRTGMVNVTLKNASHLSGLQNGRYPSPPLPVNPINFTYVTDEDDQLYRQAMALISQKQLGHVRNIRDFARNIVNGGSGPQSQWSAVTNVTAHQYGRNAAHTPLDRAFNVEAAVLKCLDLIDLDDSRHRVKLDLTGRGGQTALHLASSRGYQHLVAALLARGANPNATDFSGMSPMHMAALNGRLPIVRKLRLAGGDAYLTSTAGYIPADLAPRNDVRREMLMEIYARPRTAPLAHRFRSLPGSSVSLASFNPSHVKSRPKPEWVSSDDYEDSDEESSLAPSTPLRGAATPAMAAARSRRNSNAADSDLDTSQMQASFFLAAALATWRDRFAPQIQNLQPNMNWTLPNLPALPPMPNLPDYQAYDLYRLFSSLVPNRMPFPGFATEPSADSKEAGACDYLREASAPPAYEDIYPTASQNRLDTKVASAVQAAADACEDQKCAAAFDRPSKAQCVRASSMTAIPTRDPSADADLEVHYGARSAEEPNKVKRLRSDSRLFFIWVS